MLSNDSELRARLIAVALEWQKRFGVAPAITSALSEYDAAMKVAMSEQDYGLECQHRTAVTRGADFVYKGCRYQVKANRPSGKPGSPVTLVGKPNNYEWDKLIWILYNTQYEIQEAWLWDVDAYKQTFDSRTRISPADMRRGLDLLDTRSHPDAVSGG